MLLISHCLSHFESRIKPVVGAVQSMCTFSQALFSYVRTPRLFSSSPSARFWRRACFQRVANVKTTATTTIIYTRTASSHMCDLPASRHKITSRFYDTQIRLDSLITVDGCTRIIVNGRIPGILDCCRATACIARLSGNRSHQTPNNLKPMHSIDCY